MCLLKSLYILNVYRPLGYSEVVGDVSLKTLIVSVEKEEEISSKILYRTPNHNFCQIVTPTNCF